MSEIKPVDTNPSRFICPECWVYLCDECRKSVLRFRRWESLVKGPLLARLEVLAAREIVFDGSDPWEMDCYTAEDAARQRGQDYETALAREVLAALKQLEVPMGELKPCPFCGQDAKVYGDSDVGFCVVCLGQDIPGNKCFAAMGENYDPYAMPEHVYRTEAEAVAAWNRRAEPVGGPHITEAVAAQRITPTPEPGAPQQDGLSTQPSAPAEGASDVRCSRCGHPTKGVREGGVDYCTTCGGLL